MFRRTGLSNNEKCIKEGRGSGTDSNKYEHGIKKTLAGVK